MLEVAKIKVSNNLQGVFNLTLEGEYASYFEVQGTTLFMIKPIEDIGTYAITVVVEDPLGRFETLRADYVFNIGCCPISTRPTTTTPAPASAPTAPAPLPTEDGPEDLSTARILGIMEGLPDVQRYAMRRDTNRNQEYLQSPNYKLSSSNVWTSVRNYDSIFTYPDGTTFIREGRTVGTNSYVSEDGIMHNITSSLYIIDFARNETIQNKNIKMDYPGLFDGMRFNMAYNFLQYRDPNLGQGSPRTTTTTRTFFPTSSSLGSVPSDPTDDYSNISAFRTDIAGFVREILSPSDGSLISANATPRSRSDLFQTLLNESTAGNPRGGSYGKLVTGYFQSRRRTVNNELYSLLSRAIYVSDALEERNWGDYIYGQSPEYPSRRNYFNRTLDVDRIIDYYGLLYGKENLRVTDRYADSYRYSDNTRYEIQNGSGFSIDYYREKFHIVAVLYEIPEALYDRERRSGRYSIFPQLIVHNQQYNATTGTTKTVNPNANFSGRGVFAQVHRPTVDDVRVRNAGSPFNELVSPGNVALIAYYRIDDELARSGSNFFPNTAGPVRDRPQEEENIVLEARLFNGDRNSALKFETNGVLDRRFAESFVYSELCGATGYNSVDSVTAPTPTTTTEPPVVDDVEEVPEEEIEVFKMGNLNIEN